MLFLNFDIIWKKEKEKSLKIGIMQIGMKNIVTTQEIEKREVVRGIYVKV